MNNTEFQFVENQLWARKCSFTGIGMNEGWVFTDGNYASTQELADKHAVELGYANFDALYDEDDENYYTEWDVNFDAQYIVINGELVDFDESESSDSIDIKLEGDDFHLMFEQAGVDMPEKLEGPEFEEAFDEVRSILKGLNKSLYVLVESVEIEDLPYNAQVTCFDGFGIAETDAGKIRLTYPKIADLSDEQKKAALEYRGISSNNLDSIRFDDVMMLYGKPTDY